MKKTLLAVGMTAGLLMAGQAQATLIDRLDGLIYDDVNDISWTQVAGDGVLRNWDGQVSWADGFSLAGFDDFRLASIDELASLYGQLPGVGDKTGDISPFENIQSVYWSGTEYDALRVGLPLRRWQPGPRRPGRQPLRLGRPPWRFGGGSRAWIGSVVGVRVVRVASGTAVAG
jgi:hypothetical protein